MPEPRVLIEISSDKEIAALNSFMSLDYLL